MLAVFFHGINVAEESIARFFFWITTDGSYDEDFVTPNDGRSMRQSGDCGLPAHVQRFPGVPGSRSHLPFADAGRRWTTKLRPVLSQGVSRDKKNPEDAGYQ